jgi:tricorn protease
MQRVVAVLIVLASLALPSGASANLLRFPDIHGDTVAFVWAEDLWTVPTAGGVARRLTDDDGQERHPKLSPDGKLIAFTAEMDGNADVYVIDTAGSVPRRLTFHPGADEVIGWHPTTSKILFRSHRSAAARYDHLFLIAPDGTGVEELPLHEAGRGCFSPDGNRIVYNRIAREDRTWKRYHGGMAQDLWLYDFTTGEDRRLTDYDGTDRLPMWIGDTIYFASDRDGVLNIYAYHLETGEIEQITTHSDYDIRRPSSDDRSIVYELAGDLWLLDVATRKTQKIPITIPIAARNARPYLAEVSDLITSVDSSPQGGRVAVVARGEVFSVPVEHGPTRNLTRSSGARDKDATWSPDGQRIAYLSDASGEYEIWMADALDRSPATKLTSIGEGYRHSLRFSPDGTKIAFTDQTLSLLWVDVASGRVTTADRAEHEPMDVSLDVKPISDFAWSPDSRYLAYSKIDSSLVSKIWIYDATNGERHCVSDGLFNDFGPAFTRDGRHLVFISNRRFDPTFCDFEWEMVYKKVAGLYALTLSRTGAPLLELQCDEDRPAGEPAEDEKKEEKKEDAQPHVTIDFDGIAERIQALPLPAGNYRELSCAKNLVLYLDSDSGDYNRFEYRQIPPRRLMAFSLDERSARTLADDVISYRLSAPGSHVAVLQQGGKVGIIKIPGSEMEQMVAKLASKGDSGKGEVTSVDLSGLVMWLDPGQEWKQIFAEAWRLERDFFYDPNMHGLDWAAMRRHYQPLIDRASCQQDLRFVIGELIGELATSHTYVWTGALRREAPEISVGLLGADWDVDESAKRYRITKVYRVPDWSRGVVPPLSGPGYDVQQGDLLLTVNGRDVRPDREIFAYFQNLAGTQVRLELARGGKRYEITTVPLESESVLRYLDWVEHNRQVVDVASKGQIGYLHLPDTYLGSATEFPKYYYAQTKKKGLIIDGRFNGGGLDPDIFLARLAKKPLSYWTRRYSADQVTPVYVSRAHMVCLTNRQAGSGGDELPFEFRAKGLGPVIGTRTWGGLVGVSMFITMVDGSGLTAPDYRIYTPQGKWTVENRGVTPDIEVELDPGEMARGWDAQLQKGIEVLLEEIARDPLPEVKHPPFPSRE